MSEPIDTSAGPHIIVTTWERSGDQAWWASHGLTAARGSAVRYPDFGSAHETALRLKRDGLINDFTVERVEQPPRRSSTDGSSGRA